MTAPTNVQLSLLSPNVGVCVGVAATEAATNGHGPRTVTDTQTQTAQATTAHNAHTHRDEAQKDARPGLPEAIGHATNGKNAGRTTAPVRSRAESPRPSVLSARWEPFAVVAARRPGVAPKRVRELLERLYTAGVAERAVYGETGVELWRLADGAGARR